MKCTFPRKEVRIKRGTVHEALDGYLERLAIANGLESSQILEMMRASAGHRLPAPTVLLIKPSTELIARISKISCTPTTMLRSATLSRFGSGLPLWLDEFDPRDRHSFRRIVTQGWFPTAGSQICPTCLRENGIWKLDWRLPIVTACNEHQVFLVDSCAGCRDRFRLRRYSPLRPILGRDEPCGNQIALRSYCHFPAISHAASSAPLDVLATSTTIADAISGKSQPVLGQWANAQTYLAELRHMATVLLHLATTSRGPEFVAWAHDLHSEASRRRTERRGPRWGISPPRSASARGQALSAAHQILDEATVERGADRFAPWLQLIADFQGGPSNWLMNRTTRTASMQRLIDATLVSRRGAGRRIDYARSRRSLPLEAIPHLIDRDIYQDLFLGMLDNYEHTGRLYVSLCIARLMIPCNTWSQAAAAIGLPPALGSRTARAASRRTRATPNDLAAATSRALAALPVNRDFRDRERRVHHLAETSGTWFEGWRMSVSPPRRATSLPYAVTWLWCEYAQGWPDASPAEAKGVPHRRTQAYRSFSDRLPAEAQAGLCALISHF
jgi:hypothetical protein